MNDKISSPFTPKHVKGVDERQCDDEFDNLDDLETPPLKGRSIPCVLVALDYIERAIAAAVAAERERCALVAEAFDSLPVYERDTASPGHCIAGKIREGKQAVSLPDDNLILDTDQRKDLALVLDAVINKSHWTKWGSWWICKYCECRRVAEYKRADHKPECAVNAARRLKAGLE